MLFPGQAIRIWGDVGHVGLNTRLPFFFRGATFKNWEEPGDEARASGFSRKCRELLHTEKLYYGIWMIIL